MGARSAVGSSSRLLVVDLNYTANYPTLAVGQIIACLRAAQFKVELVSPLALGLPPVIREGVDSFADYVKDRYRNSSRPIVARPRRMWQEYQNRKIERRKMTLVGEVAKRLDDDVSLVLLSTYTENYPLSRAIANLAQQRGLPVLIGGPAFSHTMVAEVWRVIPGVTAVVGAEVEPFLGDLVDDLLSGGDIARYPGVVMASGQRGPKAPPLAVLDQHPVPDFSDFPWERYKVRTVPIMTGRGCGWGACTFCSDVVSANGRTFRSRPLSSVLGEIEEQTARYKADVVGFMDIKLNSDLKIWNGLIDNLQTLRPGVRWGASVHVHADSKEQDGLAEDRLHAAHQAGLTRISFGLESGSQRLLDAMRKGTKVARNSQFLKQAYDAGLSVRSTMIRGYPGETADDLRQTASFLRTNRPHLDRVRMSPFAALVGTPFERLSSSSPESFPGLSPLKWNAQQGFATFNYAPEHSRPYRSALRQVLREIYEVNRLPLRETARDLDGLM